LGAWYYLVKGRPHGPVPSTTIESEIKSGQLNAHDLVYKDRDTVWRELRACVEFAHFFVEKNKPEAVVDQKSKKSGEPENHWVLLVRKPDGSGYKQKGPFLSSEIAKMVKNNEILQTDYVWRDGLKEWYKIIAVGEIQDIVAGRAYTPGAARAEDQPPPPPPLSETMVKRNVAIKNLAQSEKKLAQIVKPILPDELDDRTDPSMPIKNFDPDLTQATNKEPAKEPEVVAETNTEVTREVRTARKRRPTVGATGHRLTLIRYFLELTPVNKIVFIVCTAGVVVSLLFAIFWYSSYQDRFNSTLRPPTIAEIPPLPPNAVPQPALPQPQPAKVAVAPPVPQTKPVAPVPEPQHPPPAPSPQVEVRHAPTFIQIERLGNTTDAAQLHINSDASSHYSFVVTFESVLGEVLEMPSVFVRRVVKGVGPRLIDFRRQNIPFGEYKITVESEKVKAVTTAEFGTITKDFHKLLHAHRKRLSYDQNEERFGFLKTVERLERETYKFAQGIDAAGELRSWTEFYRSWRRDFDRINSPTMSAINAKNRQKYVHASMWMQLKDIRNMVDKEAKSVNQLRLQKRATTSASAHNLATTLTQLKEQMIQASLWKN
jgi:GYF domain 2